MTELDGITRETAPEPPHENEEQWRGAFATLLEINAAFLGNHDDKEKFSRASSALRAAGFEWVRLYVARDNGEGNMWTAGAEGAAFAVGSLPGHYQQFALLFGASPRPRVLRRGMLELPPSSVALLDGEGADEMVCAPVQRAGVRVGVVTAARATGGAPLTAENGALLALFAAQFSAVSSPPHATTHFSSELEPYLKLYTDISSSLDLDQTLSSICKSAVELLQVDHSALVFFDEEHKSGVVRAEYPEDMGARGLTIPLRGVPSEEELLRSGEPMIVADVQSVVDLGPVRDILLNLDVRSLVVVPVVRKGRVIGSFSLDSVGRTRAFNPYEIGLCKHFAQRVAISLENALLFSETQERVRQLDALRQTTLSITSPHDRASLLTTIIKQAIKLLDCKSGGIYEYFPERSELEIVADHNRPKHVGNVLALGEGMAGHIVANELPHLFTSDYEASLYKAAIYNEGRPFGSVVEVPLKWKDVIIGVLYVDDVKGRQFSLDDAKLLRMFADQAAIVLEHSALAMRAEEEYNRLRMFSEATQEFMADLGSQPLDDRLALIAERAAQVLAAEVCGVWLVEDGLLTLRASHGHREDMTDWYGKKFEIRTGHGTGLTGHIAWTRQPFREHGAALASHPAYRGIEPDCSPSGSCSSLLAVPLLKKEGAEERLIGLIRASNKKDRKGRALPTLSFTKEDQEFLKIFADTVVVAIESAELVERLSKESGLRSRLVESSPNGIIWCSRSGRVLDSNERAREILGYADEPLPSNVSELYWDPEEPRRIGRKMHEGPNGRVKDYETFLRGWHGRKAQKIPVRLSATWLYDREQKDGGQRECTGSVGYFEDLRCIKETEKRLKLLLDAGNLVTQADSLSDGLERLAEMVVTLLSSSFCRILLFGEDDAELVVEAAHPIQRGGGNPLDWRAGVGDRIRVSDYVQFDRVLRAGQPLVMRWTNKKSRSNLKKFSERIGIDGNVQSLLLIPLNIDDEVVGLLDVGELRNNKRSGFDSEKIDLAAGIGAHISLLIKKLRLLEDISHRRQLLESLYDKLGHIRSELGLEGLRQKAVDLSVNLISGDAGVLFLNYPRLSELMAHVAVRFEVPTDKPFPYDHGLVSRAAQSQRVHVIEFVGGETPEPLLTANEMGSGIAVPLVSAADGATEAVLLVARKQSRPRFTEGEKEVLERFVAQANINMQTAHLMDREQRTLRHLKVLYKITDYILSEHDPEKIIRAVLNGATAGYGLGFNRAVLFLLDEKAEHLVGAGGVGDFVLDEAEDTWRHTAVHGPFTFDAFLKQLNRDDDQPSPVGEWVKSYRTRFDLAGGDAFSQTVMGRRLRRVAPGEYATLPADFVSRFSPQPDRSELVLAPLSGKGGKRVGLLLADNKFTHAPIEEVDLAALQAIADTIAIALDRLRLEREAKAKGHILRVLFEASNVLSETEGTHEILKKIAARARTAAGAKWVRIILVEEDGTGNLRAQNLISEGTDKEPPLRVIIRPDGKTVKVWREGKAEAIENSFHERSALNPYMLSDQPEAFLGLPLITRGRTLGVMWVCYERPRTFQPFEVRALQLFVNQAAAAYAGARRIEQLEELRQATDAVSGPYDLRGVLRQVAESARKALQADSAVILPYSTQQGRFDAGEAAASGIEPGDVQKFIELAVQPGGLAGAVVEHSLLCVEDMAERKAETFDADAHQPLLHLGTRSTIGISLTARTEVREVLGVLFVNYARARTFSEDELRTAQTLADQAVTALKKAWLLEQTSRAIESVETIAQAMVGETRENTLRIIAEEAMRALGCDVVTLYETNRNTGRLNHPPYTAGVRDPEGARSEGRVAENSIPYIIRERDKPEFVENVEKAPLFSVRPFVRREKIKSCVAVPLRVGGNRVGVMFINYRTPHSFTPQEKKSIQLFTTQAAIAISHAQLFDERERKNREQEALARLSKALLDTQNEQETMERAVKVAAEVFNTRYCTIAVPMNQNDYVITASVGWEGELDVDNMRLEKGAGSQTGLPEEVYGSQTALTIATGEPIIVTDYRDEDRFVVLQDLLDLGIRSGLSVPIMKDGGRDMGALLIHTKDERRFDEQDANLLSVIANQTGIAMRSQQYEVVQRQSAYLKALYDASKAIVTSLAVDVLELPDRREVLDQILRHAVEGITRISGPHVAFGDIMLYDREKKELMFESVYPLEQYDELVDRFGARRSLDSEKLGGGSIGISGLAVMRGEPQLAEDVRDLKWLPFYLTYNEATRSELAVPMKDQNGNVIGVLNVESNVPNGFDADDLMTLQALADLSVMVIKNYEQVRELVETKRQVESNRFLLWVTMTSSIWGHEVRGCAINIRNALTMVRGDFERLKLTEAQVGKLEERAAYIDRQAQLVLDRKLPPLISPEAEVKTISLNDFIRERVAQLTQEDEYRGIDFDLRLSEVSLQVRVDPDRLRPALDNLLANAARAMKQTPARRITISTRLSYEGSRVEMRVADSGPGIPQAIQPKLFEAPITKDDGGEGNGFGLMLVSAIIQAYKGSIVLESGEPGETTFLLSLPPAG
jgi:PAS domain S-box-containing protein